MTPELPPLERVFVSEDANDFEILYTTESVEARERIMLARIAELEAVKKEADHARAEQARATSERSDSLAFAIVDDALSGLLRAIDAAMKETKP